MNPSGTWFSAARVAFIFAVMAATRLPAFDIVDRGATGASFTSEGTSSAGFVFDPGTVTGAQAPQAAEFRPVPLPPWNQPINLGNNGAVLLYDWNTGTYVRWRKGVSETVEPGWPPAMNKSGQIIRDQPDGRHFLEDADGGLTPITIEGGGFPAALFYDFSSHYAVGNSQIHGDGWWDFAGGYHPMVDVGAGLGMRLVPRRINDRGDILADKVHDGAYVTTLEGAYVNDRYIAGVSGIDLNNLGSAVLASADDSRGASGAPQFWDGALHPVGASSGSAVSLNDHDEIVGYLSDGRRALWRKAADSAEGGFTLTDLGAATGLAIDTVLQINNDGVILVAAWNDAGDYQPFLLVPGAETNRLGVDCDRDGVINPSSTTGNPDHILAERGLPWYFWVNDDDDDGETIGTDIPGKRLNSDDLVVNGVRDLVDFFPVHLDIPGLLRDYPANDPTVTYKLAQADGALNFLPTELTPATAGDYQRDVDVAKSLGASPVVRITAAGVALSRAFLGKILGEEKGIILVEALKPTTAPLRLEVWRGGTREAVVELPLSVAGVETMFRHKNLVNAVGMKPETADRGGAPNWPDELNNSKVFVFVHGYNVNEKEARGWQAEFFKRLWWSGSNAQFWGVTWYGYDSQVPLAGFTPNYQINVVHAFGTAPLFKQFIDQVHAQPGITEVNVAAHSLGNMVVSSAISDHRASVERYFLLNAAVAAEAYDATEASNPVAIANMPHTAWTREYDKPYPAEVWASYWHQRFPPLGDERRKLTWLDRFGGLGSGPTACYNFFSTGDHVLAIDTDDTPSLAGVLAREMGRYLESILAVQSGQPNGYRTWAYQEKLKGRTITGKVLGSNYGGWGFGSFRYKNRAGGYGKGPVLTPVALTPDEVMAIRSTLLADEVLRKTPFFRQGSRWTKVGTWVQTPGGKSTFNIERLGLLYDVTTGSEFSKRHRDALLARMIPALSLVTGSDAVKAFGLLGPQNFDMNAPGLHADAWPLERGDRTDWRHSDLRVIAYPYVRNLYAKLTEVGSLE